MDIEALRQLSRKRLQSLAQTHKIKANLKSEEIIRLYLEQHKEEIKRTEACEPEPAREPTPPQKLPAVSSEKKPELISSGSSSSSSSRGSPGSQESDDSEYELIDEDAQASERITQHLVETLGFLAAEHYRSSQALKELNQTIATVRDHTTALCSATRVARARRTRIGAYVRYWRNIPTDWRHEDVWDQTTLRVRIHGNNWEELDSDEELSEQEDDGRPVPEGALPTLKPGEAVPSTHQEAAAALTAAATPLQNPAASSRKRSRSLDDDPLSDPSSPPHLLEEKHGDQDTDGARYSPKARMNIDQPSPQIAGQGSRANQGDLVSPRLTEDAIDDDDDEEEEAERSLVVELLSEDEIFAAEASPNSPPTGTSILNELPQSTPVPPKKKYVRQRRVVRR